MDYKIRKSTDNDMRALAELVAIVWNETYKGLVPDDYLDNLYKTIDERAERYKKNNKTMKDIYEYLLFINDELSGFIRFGKSETETDMGEIYALYVLSKYQKLGYGKKLVDFGIDKLKVMGYKKMIIACLKGNPSNDFYKHIGGVYYKDGVFKKLNLLENIYIYDI